jgi:hypothetical protein
LTHYMRISQILYLTFAGKEIVIMPRILRYRGNN